MNMEATIVTRLRFEPPKGWTKHKNVSDFSFYKEYGIVHAVVFWDDIAMRWVCELSQNRTVLAKEVFRFSHYAFSFADEFMEQR